ncbi:hypothetical protein ACFYUY_01770 [Kitasatospora sp. NPDC004745]|uniref:zinc finger domain-containing protein n=1 Tax=Kitasatospora sp. NPDC004745 TaxID=3364019 RepID=UPI00368AC0BF
MANRAAALAEPPRRLTAPLPPAHRVARLLEAVEQRRLTPVEAGELSRAYAHLTACLASAGEQLRRLIDEGEQERDEHTRRLLRLRHPGLDVDCGRCGAAVGVWCRPVSGVVVPRTLHMVRLVAAGVVR